jgi:hypothetical protein
MTCVRSCDESRLNVGLCMCFVSIVSFYYLSSSLSSGLGTHCSTFLSRIHPLSMPWERSCDGFWLRVALYRCSVSMVSFYYVSVISANSSPRSIHFQRSVSVVPQFPRSVSASQFSLFPVLSLSHLLFYSVLVLRFRFRYPVVFNSSPSSYSLFHLVSLTRHPNNMSPIMTFLVSGLLPFVSAMRRLYRGVSSHVPRTIHGLLFFCP